MKNWIVTVEVPGNPAFSITVDAPDEWKARTKAMAHYPHPLRGALVEYQVRAKA